MRVELLLSFLIVAYIQTSYAALEGETIRSKQYGSPAMSAQLIFNPATQQFEQDIKIIYKGVALENIRKWAMNAEIIPKVTNTVKSASFKVIDNKDPLDPYNILFNLKLGNFLATFDHSFKCKEEATPTSWTQECVEIPPTNEESAAIFDAVRGMQCREIKVANSKEERTECNVIFSGRVKDIGSHSAINIAYGFFVASTKYLAHMNLLVSGAVPNITEAIKYFETTEYVNMMKELEAKQPKSPEGNDSKAVSIKISAATANYLKGT